MREKPIICAMKRIRRLCLAGCAAFACLSAAGPAAAEVLSPGGARAGGGDGPAAERERLRRLVAHFPEGLVYSGWTRESADALKAGIAAARALLNDPAADAAALRAARETIRERHGKLAVSGRYADAAHPRLQSIIGWEGDQHAPIVHIDGSMRLINAGGKDRMMPYPPNGAQGGAWVRLGVADIPGKIRWYNAEGYLPCQVHEFAKDGIRYTVEEFANKKIIGGRPFELAYVRMRAVNGTGAPALLPVVSPNLVPLGEYPPALMPGETSVREWVVGADRFGGGGGAPLRQAEQPPFPAASVLKAQGDFDSNYREMRRYWNGRLASIVSIDALPNPDLVDAFKAGYIYMLIVKDGTELHVGEQEVYDCLFTHDTIGIAAALFEMGDRAFHREYLASIPLTTPDSQNAYWDANWKYAWPYAEYVKKTGDTALFFDAGGNLSDVFKKVRGAVRSIEADRYCRAHNRAGCAQCRDPHDGIMKMSKTIDARGQWTVDNWSALFGLAAYRYLCAELKAAGAAGAAARDALAGEIGWSLAQYAGLMKAYNDRAAAMIRRDSLPYLPISLTDSRARSPKDANWASMFLFGRWAWDGYLYGAEQEGPGIEMIDATYRWGMGRRIAAGETDSRYSFGGYGPAQGWCANGYNAGYGSAALRGKACRETAVRAYEFMIGRTMGGPFSWWESCDFSREDSPWDRPHASGRDQNGGTCPHIWGQSVNSKALLDALAAEKISYTPEGEIRRTLLIGRGIPREWTSGGAGTVAALRNIPVGGGRKAAFRIEKTGAGAISVALDTPIPASIELPGLADGIADVSANAEIGADGESVRVASGKNTVTIRLKRKAEKGSGVNRNERDT